MQLHTHNYITKATHTRANVQSNNGVKENVLYVWVYD